MKRHLRSATALAALTFTSQFVAFADPDAAESDRRLETVTVTTQKQEQTLIDVPINVSVTDQDLIDKLAADDLEDLGNFVPGLQVLYYIERRRVLYLIARCFRPVRY